MIKPLLTFAGKFVPGVNYLMAGYSVYQAGDVIVRVVGVIRGDDNVPIPVVSSGSLTKNITTSIVSSVISGGAVSLLGKGMGNDKKLLDKYEEKLGIAVGEFKKELDKVKEDGEGTTHDLKSKININKALHVIQQIVLLYLDEYIRIFPRYETSFRNIKLLLASNSNDYEGLIKVYETLYNGPRTIWNTLWMRFCTIRCVRR